MSWGIIFKTDINIPNKHFHCVEDVQECIDDTMELIECIKRDIYGVAMSTPKDITPVTDDEGGHWEPLEYISFTLHEKFELLEEYYVDWYKLEKLKENFETSENF